MAKNSIPRYQVNTFSFDAFPARLPDVGSSFLQLISSNLAGPISFDSLFNLTVRT
jgi:hypothetical protein